MLPNKSRTPGAVEKLPGTGGMGVRMEGLEPPWVAPLDPKSSASTNFATSARFLRPFYAGLLKRVGKVMDYCRIEKEPTHSVGKIDSPVSGRKWLFGEFSARI